MQLLTTTSPEEVSERRQQLTDIGTLPEFPTLDEIIKDSQHHAHLRSICDVPAWTAEAIRNRGNNLCQLGYQQLLKWL
jgi:hypothetical protein